MSVSSVSEVNEEGYELSVTVEKQAGVCGFSFANIKLTVDSDEIVYIVQHVLSENARRSLRPGDRLLSINGELLQDKTRIEVVRMFQRSPTLCQLVIWRPTLGHASGQGHGQGSSETPPWLQGIRERERNRRGIHTKVKVKKKDGTLGIKVTSYEDPAAHGLASGNNFYITEIRSDHSARYLCVGDKLLKINGDDLEGKTHADVIRMLTSSPITCYLEVSRSSPVSVPGGPPPSYDELVQWDVTNTFL